MKTTTQMSGQRELGLAMKDLDSKVQKRIARSVTSAGSRIIAKEAKVLVPVDEGTVKKNIRTKNLKPTQPGQQETIVYVRAKGKTKDSAWYWTQLEFGNVKMAPRPFMRPAFESKKQEAAQKMKDQLAKRIDIEVAKIGKTIGKA